MASLSRSTGGNTHLANDMTLLLNKIENRLGLLPLTPHLPNYLGKEKWGEIIETDTLVTFSRYFPNRFKMQINDTTCDKKRDESNITWYYIKDEQTAGVPILGVTDLDWSDTSARNSGLAQGVGNGYYAYDVPCITGTFESVIGLQMNADFASLYNRQIYIDFEYPNRFCLKGLGNISYDLTNFVIVVLTQHVSLTTISPTKQEIFEDLAIADIARFLYMNLRYYDGLETAYINLDLKLSELQEVVSRREQVIDELKNSYVSASNDYQSMIMTV